VGVDRKALEASLRRLDRLAVGQLDMASLLNRVVGAAGQLFPVSGAGLMVVDTAHELRYLASSDQVGRWLEDAQLQTGEGPCVDAFILDRPVHTADVLAEQRWPRLRRLLEQALEKAKVRAVLGVPVRLGGGPVGILWAYIDDPCEWDEDDVEALCSYARVIENLLALSVAAHRSDQLAGQLQYALDYRVAIERAIGFVMARDGVDAVTAFNGLRTKARNSRRKIGEVAEETVRGEPLA
jgi:GAF domain-containing protein